VHTISREKLYEQVWSRPITKVAADFGVTGAALKKTSNRHKIPTPKRGYWAKLEHDRPVRQLPLPKLTNVGLDQASPERALQSCRNRQARQEARERLTKVSEPAAAGGNDFLVEEPPILGATRRAISRARPNAEGLTNAQGRGVVPLKIAPGSTDRTLQLLARLFALAETEG
jgi:hypothetical protein